MKVTVMNLNKKQNKKRNKRKKTVNNSNDDKLDDMMRIKTEELTEKDKKSARIC